MQNIINKAENAQLCSDLKDTLFVYRDFWIIHTYKKANDLNILLDCSGSNLIKQKILTWFQSSN